MLKKQKNFIPDFLIIPYQLMQCNPAERFVYAACYFFEKMNLGKCIASNTEIARIAGVSKGTVRNCLMTLVRKKFLKCFYKDKKKKIRKKIKCLISFQQVSSTDDTPKKCYKKPFKGRVSSTDDRVSSTDDTWVSSVSEQSSNRRSSKIYKRRRASYPQATNYPDRDPPRTKKVNRGKVNQGFESFKDIAKRRGLS